MGDSVETFKGVIPMTVSKSIIHDFFILMGYTGDMKMMYRIPYEDNLLKL